MKAIHQQIHLRLGALIRGPGFRIVTRLNDGVELAAISTLQQR